jgi:hypothetical protein
MYFCLKRTLFSRRANSVTPYQGEGVLWYGRSIGQDWTWLTPGENLEVYKGRGLTAPARPIKLINSLLLYIAFGRFAKFIPASLRAKMIGFPLVIITARCFFLIYLHTTYHIFFHDFHPFLFILGSNGLKPLPSTQILNYRSLSCQGSILFLSITLRGHLRKDCPWWKSKNRVSLFWVR